MNIRIVGILYFVFLSLLVSGYSISGRIKGITNQTIKLGYYYGHNTYLKDTCVTTAQGEFLFKGIDTLANGQYILILPNKYYYEFIVNKEQTLVLKADTSDYIESVAISENKETALYYRYLKQIDPLSKKISSLGDRRNKKEIPADSVAIINNEISNLELEIAKVREDYILKNPQTFVGKLFTAMQEPIVLENISDGNEQIRWFKNHYFDGIDFSDPIYLRTPIFYQKLKTYIRQITNQHPDSIAHGIDFLVSKAAGNDEVYKFVLYYLTYVYETSHVMVADNIFIYLADNYYLNGKAQWMKAASIEKIKEEADRKRPTLLNAVAPDLKMMGIKGDTIQLHNVKAKFTLMVFWDPDCGHCQESMPVIKEQLEKVKKHDVTVFSIGTMLETQKWKKYIEDKHLENFINVHDVEHKSLFRVKYNLRSTPLLLLLDSKKKILAKNFAAEDIESILTAELEQP